MVDRLVDHRDSWDNLDGDYLEVEGAINRVRERERQSAQALTDEARRKDDLVTYLAHDLKTPLASVVGYLSLLQEAPDLPWSSACALRGLRWTRRIVWMPLSRSSSTSPVSISTILFLRAATSIWASCLPRWRTSSTPSSDQRKRRLYRGRAELTVLVDGDKMARVFNNIMKNAIAYSYEGSTIRVSADREQDAATGAACAYAFENQETPFPRQSSKVILRSFTAWMPRATNRGGAGLVWPLRRKS